MTKPFKEEKSFEERLAESKRIREKHPDRIPVICEKSTRCNKDIPDIDKRKYLVPSDLTMGQFIYVIRKRMNLTPHKSIFLFVNHTLPQSSELISKVYEKCKDQDGFLYIEYSSENTFG